MKEERDRIPQPDMKLGYIGLQSYLAKPPKLEKVSIRGEKGKEIN